MNKLPISQIGEKLASHISDITKRCILTYGSSSKADAVYLATCAAQAALQIVAQLVAPEQPQANIEANKQQAPVRQNLN